MGGEEAQGRGPVWQPAGHPQGDHSWFDAPPPGQGWGMGCSSPGHCSSAGFFFPSPPAHAERAASPGAAAGLVWTAAGGQVQYIECVCVGGAHLTAAPSPGIGGVEEAGGGVGGSGGGGGGRVLGQGALTLTGQLGDVLEESARIALRCAPSGAWCCTLWCSGAAPSGALVLHPLVLWCCACLTPAAPPALHPLPPASGGGQLGTTALGTACQGNESRLLSAGHQGTAVLLASVVAAAWCGGLGPAGSGPWWPAP